MVRKRVEGLTIDLTRIPENGQFILENLIVVEPVKPSKLPFPEWLEELYNNPCSFCGDKHTRMHFDHINMFDKNDCVSSMAYRGCSKEEIIEEVNKCQLLCVPCHDKITRIERRNGFITKKQQLNSLIRSGADVKELRSALKADYSALMEGVYAGLRGGYRSRASTWVMIGVIVLGIASYM